MESVGWVIKAKLIATALQKSFNCFWWGL